MLAPDKVGLGGARLGAEKEAALLQERRGVRKCRART